ncbi:secreted antigen 1 [Babesia divergens]|uniref:Secreted antigen 1 n=1 Tax=Babesia divergens TaxID=32595 RepID=A0AAD9GJN0_BABDI|nr:secreted antigen 1 [Babesia divergens]
MKFLGILRASALCLLVSAFHGSRGTFCSNLEVYPSAESSTVEVPEISENLEDSTVEPSSHESLPSSHSDLVFESSEWHDSHLASSVLFIEEFCRDVISKKFNGKLSEAEYDHVSRACVYLSFKLESVTNHFTPTYGPGSASERKEIDKKIYEGKLKPEDFDVYAIWLEKNIQNIIKSYQKMLEESAKLTEKELKTETSMGPLKYGFVYNGYWWGEIIYWLPPDVYADTGFLEALKELKISLDKIPKSPVETSTVDHQINDDDDDDDVEGSSKVHESDVSENLDGSPVESPLVEEAEDSTVKYQSVEKPSQEPSSESSAPVAKSGLVFKASSWHDSHLASTVLFVREFCKEVNAKKFDAHIPDANIVKLSKATYAVSLYLDSLTDSLLPRYGPGIVTERKEIPRDLYKGILKPEKFKDYAKWLKENIPVIMKSITNMYNDGLKLSKEQLKTDTEVGPLKYGFVHKACWWSMALGDPGLTAIVPEAWSFSGALKSLQKRLDHVLKKAPTKSTVKSQAV